ncbi:MarR family winged helix-turn-helix transcriptional regulator [bacterium]|nr:MarR family winged helix-turn-helix transcriptional regulator [bacterium]
MNYNPDEIFPFWVNRTAFIFRALFEQRAEPFGLKWLEGVILLKLGMGHDTLADLARNLDQSHPAILRHLDKLEELGLVERTNHPEDRRVKILVLTKAGKSRVAELQDMTSRLSNEFRARFGSDRIAQAITLMKEVVAAYAEDGLQSCPIDEEHHDSDKQAGHA